MKKNPKKIILMYFQMKRYFEKHSALQSQTHNKFDGYGTFWNTNQSNFGC